MSERVSSDEQALVSRLVAAGLDRPAALTALLLATRGFSRPMNDLVATLGHYPGLEDSNITRVAIDTLIARGWISRATTPLGYDMVAPASTIPALLAGFVGDPAMEQNIVALQVQSAEVEVIGPLATAPSYESYAERLRNAQNEVLMVMVMTDPKALETVKILKERASNGVRIRVVGASTKVVERLRGPSQVGPAKRHIAEWHRLAGEHANIEYRISDHDEDMLFATTVLIDREILRLVLHDPYHERSKQGLLVEVAGGRGKHLNLVRDFAARFELAWKHARKPGLVGAVLRPLTEAGSLVFGVILLVLIYWISDPQEGLGKALGASWQPFLFNIGLLFGPGLIGASIQRALGRKAERQALALPKL